MSAAVLPGATIGILGGGQLGRMLAMAARTLGYHIIALDPDASCAARFVVDRCITAPFSDPNAAAELAKASNVVTLEIEKIAIESMQAAAKHAPVRPAAPVLQIVQDRAVQKTWLEKSGFPVGPWAHVRSAAQLEAAAERFGKACFVKATRDGYDGRGQVEIASGKDANRAWKELNGECVVEKALSIAAEISILVARRPNGDMAIHPPALNHHENRILEYSVMPAPMAPRLAMDAAEIAQTAASQLQLEGLLVVEFFVTNDGKLLVNELAPRPHNTFHGTEIGCMTSQFEQAVRAVCDLPLGSTDVLRPVAIHNLLGDLWVGGAQPAFERALALAGVRVHLYGKREARPGRKMGHLSATGRTPEEAVALVRKAAAALV